MLLGLNAFCFLEIKEEKVKELVYEMLLLDVDIQDVLLEVVLLACNLPCLLFLPLLDVFLEDLALVLARLHTAVCEFI